MCKKRNQATKKEHSMSAVTCTNCGLENIADRRTCKHCQTALEPAHHLTPATAYTAPHATAPQSSLPVAASGYEYLVVPFVGNLKSGLFNLQNAGAVTLHLQSVINHYVAQGWDYYSTEKINILVTAGCLASLFGQRDSFITFDQIIFRRQHS
jgi:hypothetical protein